MRLRKAFPYQERAIEKAFWNERLAIFMEMRLGKSLVVIRALKEDGCKTNLIVAPLSSLGSWEKELQKEGIDYIVISSKKPYKFLPPDFYYLTNFEALRKFPDLVEEYWDAVVIDESTRIKNPKAQITKLITNGFKQVERKHILTGLPDPEGPLDLFCQFKFLNEEFLGFNNYWSFRRALFYQAGFDWLPKPGTIGRIKQAILENAFSLTRKKAGIGSKKIYERRYCSISSQQRKLRDQVLKDWEIEGKQTKWAPVKWQWLHRLSGGIIPGNEKVNSGKIKELITLLTGELKREKVVIFCRYLGEMESIIEALKDNHIWFEFIYGKVDYRSRTKRRDIFVKSVPCQVFLSQTECGRYSLDLSVSSTMIFYSNSASGETRSQCEDRIVHPLKKEPLLYIDLLTQDMPDEILLDSLKEKKLNADLLMRRSLKLCGC